MPKPLTRPQPSSAVANILDTSALQAALARPSLPVQEANIQTSPPMAARGETEDEATEGHAETPTIRRQFILTPTADATLKQLVDLYSRATKSELTNSHCLRAVLKALATLMPQLEREARHLGALKRPKNDRASEAHREDFEQRIATAILAGMRVSQEDI
jgi:hypothetical protein